MTIDDAPTVTPDVIRSAVPIARTIINPEWLEKERHKRPRDPVLLELNRAIFSTGQARHATRFGVADDVIHPIAEALIAGKGL